MPDNYPRRGDVYFASLDPVIGSEQGGQRPVLVIQNDVNNQYSPVVIIASMTSVAPQRHYPTDVTLEPGVGGAPLSRIQLNQIRTIDKHRLTSFVESLSTAQMNQVDTALKISLGLIPVRPGRT